MSISCRRVVHGVLAAAVAAGAGTTAAPALAQNVLMDDIVVTAQRREEQAQEVPIAITALNAEQLQRLQVQETLDLTKLVPNLIGHNNTGLGTANTYSLRGLNNTESIATFDPPVGSYIDDIYVTRQNANNFTLFDVDRVEVLRGPQGTLFGRNTTGGAVRVILKKPGDTLGGYAEVGAGEFDRYQARGSFDLPLTDRIKTKVSGYYVQDNGYVKSRNIATVNCDDILNPGVCTTGPNTSTKDDINEQKNWGIRLATLIDITDDITWELSGDYIRDERANLQNWKQNGNRFSNTANSPTSSNLVGLMQGSKAGNQLGNLVESKNLTSVVDWNIGDAGTLSFITGWRDMDQNFNLDFCDNRVFCAAPPPAPAPNISSPPPAPGTDVPWGAFTIANDGVHKQLTQEIKWVSSLGDSIDYVAGFFYLDEDNNTNFGDIFSFPIGPGVTVPLLLADRVLKNETESYAVYLQADYKVTDRWTITTGIRYTDEEKQVEFRDFNPLPDTDPGFTDSNGDGIDDFDLETVNLGVNNIPKKIDEEVWTPRFAAEFRATDEVAFYASATRGFKSGGWNARGTTADVLLEFDKETVWSYELGMKSDWLDNRLRANITAFYSDVEDFQLPSAFSNASGGITFITQNFADLENKGIEAEFVFVPWDPLTLFMNLGIQDASYENIDNSIKQQQAACRGGDAASCANGIVDDQGNIADPVRAPDYTLNLGFNYAINLPNDLELVPGAYIYHVDDHNVGTSGTPESLVSDYTLLNASITLNSLSSDWSLSAECRNCSDRRNVVSTLARFQYLDQPRTWLIRFRKGFGGEQ
jgi:iron complex outermembrane receptor protein